MTNEDKWYDTQAWSSRECAKHKYKAPAVSNGQRHQFDLWSILCKSKSSSAASAPFAILSHTWDAQEVTFQDFSQLDTRTAARGWAKIQKTCRQALECGHAYVWIDSCCIDKTNNAELTESINSMFQWYSDAALCLVTCLMSTPTTATPCAPPAGDNRAREAYFYDRAWRFFGTRDMLCHELVSITGIDASVLSPPPGAEIRDLLAEIPVARRMAWAASRQTTKLEDTAYSLIGLFGVNMPMLYGEGAQAFVRLQEEIIRDNNDLTLFAWTAKMENQGSPSVYRGILAQSPAEFAGLGNLVLDHDLKFNSDYSMSNKGLRIHTYLHPTQGTEDVVMPLHCHTLGTNGQKMPQLGLFLKHEGASVYVRIRPQMLATLSENTLNSAGNDIFVSKRYKPKRAPVAGSNTLGAVYFNIQGLQDSATVQLIETAPRELWDAQNRVFVTSGLRSFTAFHKFQLTGNYIGHLVVACGFSEASRTPWVHMEDVLGALHPAANVKDYQAVAQIGAAKGHLKARKQDLMMFVPTSNTMKARFGVAKLQCEQRLRDGEQVLVVNLELKKNNAVAFHLF
ncbi:hypothetical protein PG994_001463 [Apiospora phragmitis]|uniref:Heterokaryon incompatibility domain-containing protein n=1 Tax=Apiospora phragmitis TaxID=2905665 RepID=A0ABR1WTM4_9PEZI